jgi:hypothetical protein
MVLNGGFADWNEVNLAALRSACHLLTDEARSQLDAYEMMRKGGFVSRLKAFAASPMRRQTFIGNVALFIAVALKKI